MPAKKAKPQPKLQVKLVKSLICSKKNQLATAQALGLRKIGDVSLQPDNAATQGKLRVLAHLIETHPVESADSPGTPAKEGGAA